ncbi:LamB/YcsF family protein [Paenibacillus hamazuiensis]|uniref:LamB/YcsF family protein n=1 Tax=Paenibacillus hamazuiensis TaxID=2936508 RepID=UPI00200E8A66|nr:5-oxoprolinase subunit PxpA [Paenibacillus hamazuiensis]
MEKATQKTSHPIQPDISSPRIDLNSDMGESFGAYRIGQDERLLDYVSSANIACGFHAGDPGVMRRTVRLCLDRGVAIGAHPGLPDLAGFGRRELKITAGEAYELTVYQIGALQAFVRAEGGALRHVKPHGALYNMAAADPALAAAIAEAVQRVDPALVLFGLAGSELIRAAARIGLRAAAEAFADRAYRPDGALAPRSERGAVIADAEAAARQAVRIARQRSVTATDGHDIVVAADTLCIHGDGPHALEFAARIRQELEAAGVTVRAFEP